MISDIIHPTKRLKMSEPIYNAQSGKTLKQLAKESRQNAALGAETTAKLNKMKVLIVGLRGVGIETAKNLSLQGVGAITIIDSTPTKVQDTGLNFFLTNADVGNARSHSLLHRLHELNPICHVKAAPELTDAIILEHTALIITEPKPLTELVRLNNLCRASAISFFYAFTGGLATSVFVDHGDNHMVHDPNGEKPIQKIIIDVVSLGNGQTLIVYDHPSGQLPETISSGHFEITEIQGGRAPVNGQVFEICRDDSDRVKSIRVAWDSSDFRYSPGDGGMLTEKKLPKPYLMLPLADKIREPGSVWVEPPSIVMTDPYYAGGEHQQHVAFVATHKFLEERGMLPQPNNDEEAAEVLRIAQELLSSKAINLEDFEVNGDIVKKYALLAGVEIQALSAFTGGVLAQEVVKISGKFTPIPGFVHFSAFETLPDNRPSAEETAPKGHRNDELAAVFGWPFVEQLGNLKYFMVGCGALGCEFLKNFALNGVCCGPAGKLFVTDADRIEPSNLTRQFLFREHNVGQLKSLAAGVMAKQMNPDFKVQHLELYVGPKTEDTFDDSFWMGLDGICNALDNMEARQYVDAQCVKYEKSLLESGTMGTGGNVDTVVPFKTKTYREGGAASEGGGVPMCTLRNFPQITDHCIEWARDQFALLFTKLVKSCESYVLSPLDFRQEIDGMTDTAQAIFITRSVASLLRAIASPSIGACAQLSFDLYHFLFRDRILDLQNTFPADYRKIGKDGKDQGPYWSDKKRFPRVQTFNPDDESHTSFLLSCTCLFGVAIGLLSPKKEDDDLWLNEYRHPSFIAEIASKLAPPEYIFCPVKTEDVAEEEGDAATAPVVNRTSILDGLFQDLSNITQQIRLPELQVAEFEKDDDMNFHIAFITAAANLRCDNYYIKRTDFQACKVIAGKIIAAIATTTAAVCGLVILELFKVAQGKPTDSYMNRQIGLSVNTFPSFTADPPKPFKTHTVDIHPDPSEDLPVDAYDEKGKLKSEYITKSVKRAYPDGHSVWSKLTCSGSLTLKEFSEWLATEHNLKMTAWDFIVGYKPVFDEDGKKTGIAGVSSPVYPPKVVVDYSLLPSLDLNLQQAARAIMVARLPQEYQNAWKQCKAAGALPSTSGAADPDVITASTTIKDILAKMERIGSAFEADKAVESRTVTGIAGRTIWVIPANETPTCIDLTTGDVIESLCSIKFIL